MPGQRGLVQLLDLPMYVVICCSQASGSIDPNGVLMTPPHLQSTCASLFCPGAYAAAWMQSSGCSH
jgi:hypothetical protein